MGACCSSNGSSAGGTDKKKTPTGSSLTPFEDLSSLSTRSKKNSEKLDAIIEEKEPIPSPNNLTQNGRRSPKGRSVRDGLLTSSTTARGANEYQQAYSSLNPTGSGSSVMGLGDEQVLLSIPFFDALDTKHVKILRSFFTRRVYAPKEVVLAEGLPLGQQVFHIIINGRVEMCAKDSYGKRTVLQQFGPGEWFGEMTWGPTQDQIQPVTVYALQKTTILYTSSYQFAAALEQFPQLSVAINIMNPDQEGLASLHAHAAQANQYDEGNIEGLTNSYRAASATGPRSLGIGAPIQIQLKNIPFFAGIEELKLQQLAMLCEIRKKKAGTWICRQGADADGFYYIIKGRVEVSAHGFMEVEDLMANKDHLRNSLSVDGGKRGSGNNLNTREPHSGRNPEDSPVLSGGRKGLLNAPSTPLTAGFTPSPPSTPSQRPQQALDRSGSSRKGSFMVGGRGGSFSASRGTSAAVEHGYTDGPGDESTTPHQSGVAPGQNAYLDTLSEGDWFGEIALIEKTTRTASVQAMQDCILLYLSRERFIRFLKFAPNIRSSAIFADLIRKRTANSLKTLPIFAPLKIKTIGPYNQFDEKRLALLGGMFHYLSVPANTNIFNEGDFGMAFYIVIQGTCIVSAKSANADEDVVLSELHENDWFGESSLMNKIRCNATVKTKTNCLLLKLNGENFQKFLQIAPEVENLFRQRVSMRTSERLRSIPFFRNVRENKPWSKLDLLGSLFTFEEFSNNEVVFNQGTIGTKFYIIVAGEIEISVAKEKESGETHSSRQVLEVLTHNSSSFPNSHHHPHSTLTHSGSWFGEIALLRKTARTATARCVSPNGAVLLSIDSTKFQKFLTIAPELSEDFQSLLIHRTSNLLKSFDLFKQVQENKPWSKMEMIASLFDYELVEQGSFVYRIGDEAKKFYVIASGTVRIESKWAGMRTLHSQSQFGAMELMRNIQSEKAHKASKMRYARVEDERKSLNEQGALPSTIPPLPSIVPLAPDVVRTHSAKAVDLCGLMSMSVNSFKSLLTIAPEIIPYFAALAEHEHRKVSEMGEEELLLMATPKEYHRELNATNPTETQNGADAHHAPLDIIHNINSIKASPSNNLHVSNSGDQHKGSISALVLPPISPTARGHPNANEQEEEEEVSQNSGSRNHHGGHSEDISPDLQASSAGGGSSHSSPLNRAVNGSSVKNRKGTDSQSVPPTNGLHESSSGGQLSARSNNPGVELNDVVVDEHDAHSHHVDHAAEMVKIEEAAVRLQQLMKRNPSGQGQASLTDFTDLGMAPPPKPALHALEPTAAPPELGLTNVKRSSKSSSSSRKQSSPKGVAPQSVPKSSSSAASTSATSSTNGTSSTSAPLTVSTHLPVKIHLASTAASPAKKVNGVAAHPVATTTLIAGNPLPPTETTTDPHIGNDEAQSKAWLLSTTAVPSTNPLVVTVTAPTPPVLPQSTPNEVIPSLPIRFSGNSSKAATANQQPAPVQVAPRPANSAPTTALSDVPLTRASLEQQSAATVKPTVRKRIVVSRVASKLLS